MAADQAGTDLEPESSLDTVETLETPAITGRPIRVLAIDDEAEILDLITYALPSERGFEVCTARDGAEGLQTYYRERPDCVLVDVQMPVMSGFQFLRALRGDRESAQTPVIILSALDGDAHHEAGELSGCDVYLRKPFNVNALQAAIRRVMRISSEERERRQQELADAAALRTDATAKAAPKATPEATTTGR